MVDVLGLTVLMLLEPAGVVLGSEVAASVSRLVFEVAGAGTSGVVGFYAATLDSAWDTHPKFLRLGSWHDDQSGGEGEGTLAPWIQREAVRVDAYWVLSVPRPTDGTREWLYGQRGSVLPRAEGWLSLSGMEPAPRLLAVDDFPRRRSVVGHAWGRLALDAELHFGSRNLERAADLGRQAAAAAATAGAFSLPKLRRRVAEFLVAAGHFDEARDLLPLVSHITPRACSAVISGSTLAVMRGDFEEARGWVEEGRGEDCLASPGAHCGWRCGVLWPDQSQAPPLFQSLAKSLVVSFVK